MKLVLASASPRRAEILRAAGFEFTIRVGNVPEVRSPGESPTDYSRRLASEKAEAAWIEGDEVVLAADTIVIAARGGGLGEDVLEKPVSRADAVSMLRKLAGRDHDVVTAICLRHASGSVVDHAKTRVRFAAISDAEIEAYVDSGEPYDKAGGYGIQGLASKFVERIDGCYFNVMGLPVSLFYGHYKTLFTGDVRV